MKKNVLAVALALMASIGAYAEKNTISSPDGKLNVVVEDRDGKLYYSIDYAGKRMMEESQLGLLANVGDFSQGLTFQSKKEAKVEKSYDLRTAKVSHVDYHANQLHVTYINGKKQPMTVTFNVSNNDVAFRYTFDQLKAQHLIVNEEKTAFNLPKVTTTYLCPQSDPLIGFARTKPSYEEDYKVDQPLSAKSGYGHGYTFPCLFKVGGDGWVLVSETGTHGNYPGCHISDYDAAKGYQIAFPMEKEADGIGSTSGTFILPGSTPWRTITVGSDLKPLVETTIPYDVVEPRFEASQKYGTGKYAWSWLIWQDGSINYDDQVKMIDVAAAQEYEAVLVDALWDKQIGRKRIEELSKYAKSKKVSLMLWYNSNGFENDAPQTPRQIMNNAIARKKEMAWMKKIGVVGIKVDFFGGDKQETMKLYEDILSDANDYGLEVIFHGCTLPRGWERMYPNYVSSEAALASENVYFTDYHAKKEAFEMTMHPFSRNAVASFDWGGVMMNKYFSKDNKSRHQRFTSDIFEMATAITNQSSVNCICLYPNNLQDVPQWELDWLKNVPTDWEDTRFIAGYPTKYAVIARKAGNLNGSGAALSAGKWFVGGLNATDKPLALTLDLPMFAGKTVTYLTDQPKKKGEKFFTSVKKTLKVGKNGKAKVVIQPNGGIIIE